MTVYLVGAGPGASDLLTLRAARLLATADVVIHDRLVGPDVLAMVSPWARLIDVGKNPNGNSVSQGRINEILVETAPHHDVVVRLKGGDPLVFGRGGEEAIALADAGFGCEVVPGITSAIAGPAAAGIPVTHRGVSSGFTVITGFQHPGTEHPLDWDAIASLGTTLVILMGASRAQTIHTRLVDGGAPHSTPVAIITNASTPEQRIERMELSALGDRPIDNPSIIVVGPVASFDLARTHNTGSPIDRLLTPTGA